jgi:putative Holliday junction resolvase
VSAREGRLLALDLGDVRIGTALSDPLGITAQPLGTMERIGPRKDLQRIDELVREHEVKTVIVGYPLLMSGEEGESAVAAREFAEALRRRSGRVQVELWDERLTTVEAERTMISFGASRRQRRKIADTVAAVLILQSYLDSRSLDGGGAG